MLKEKPKVENLYPNIPPTTLRGREEKQRKAKNVPFWHFIADFVFFRMLENRFYSIIIKNEENFKKRNPNYATICYTSHTNWWDGIFTYYITRKVLGGKYRLMIEEMNRFPLFQYIGCFPVNKKSAQTAMKSLQYATTFLNDKDIVYCMFPQGIIKPPFSRPIEFQTGLAYLIKNAVKNAGGINLQPISTMALFLREDRPEYIAEFGEPIVIENDDFDRKQLTDDLSKEFENLLDSHFEQVRSGNFEGYHYLFKRKHSWWRGIERKLKSIGIKNK